MKRLINGVEFKTSIYLGKETRGYMASKTGGIVYSTRSGKLLSSCISGNTKYPRVGIQFYGEKKTVNIHQLVAEAWVEKPIPDGISVGAWNQTPEEVKALISRNYFEVDHIDGNPENNDADNLRWIDRKANKDAYNNDQRYRNG
jgi:hypothetical protein